MRCPSCGAFYKEKSVECPECGAIQDTISAEPIPHPQSAQSDPPQKPKVLPKTAPKRRLRTSPALIEFPVASKSSVPEWRKELCERVREVQERRAREATLESEAETRVDCGAETAPLLELLPQAELPPMNPLVMAALRRIERAHADSQQAGNAAVATAVACEEQPELELNFSTANDDVADAVPKPEKVHNLAVVRAPAVTQVDSENITKPRRLIAEDLNDPALNYLDRIPTSLIVEDSAYRSAPIILRVLSAFFDLAIVCLFSIPFLALTELTNLGWQNARVIGFAVGTLTVVGFLYLTVSTALTGRTMAMKLFSLRVVDARTGLIPTGSQSAGRALVYILSLASAGVVLMYALLDSEKYTVHDRFTRTAVIRA